MGGIPRERTRDDTLAEAGVEITHSHLIVEGRRYLLSAIVAYGPERRRRHYRAPVVALVAGAICLAASFLFFDGPGSSLGLLGLGTGALLLLDGTLWAGMALKSPGLEIVTASGRRTRVSLPSAEVLLRVLTALDEATAAARH